MKHVITLDTALKVNDKEIKKVEIDFDKVNGRVLLECEKLVKGLGDNSVILPLSMTFQAMVASKIIGVPYDDLLDLPSSDFLKVTNEVRAFLMR
ncbi:phage tail assembly protein [Veillonella magna]|uniref:phage tail assembly protein n=1 Tax=Veillonella magna TaxID=464322 RepID=UPI0023F4B176|nr:phage tail assembly protein [Veillonella magna]